MFDETRRLLLGQMGLLAAGSLISPELGGWHGAWASDDHDAASCWVSCGK